MRLPLGTASQIGQLAQLSRVSEALAVPGYSRAGMRPG